MNPSALAVAPINSASFQFLHFAYNTFVRRCKGAEKPELKKCTTARTSENQCDSKFTGRDHSRFSYYFSKIMQKAERIRAMYVWE